MTGLRWHLIEGEAGCQFARDKGCAAIVVDALRASATAAMLLHHGAQSILAVREVEEALAAKQAWPDALLFGERGGLPPEGFDYGNSPREAPAGKDRRIIFTTTTGAGRLVACWGARVVMMGTTLNAEAVIDAARSYGTDVVVIPAGLMTDPDFYAQEDWGAAVFIAASARMPIGEGAEQFREWDARIADEGIEPLFHSAPHAEKLRKAGMEADIPVCAKTNVTDAVPIGLERNEFGYS